MKPRSGMNFPIVVTTCLLIAVSSTMFAPTVLSQGSQGNTTDPPSTHLNVPVKDIVNLESFCIANDNSLTNQFYYDRQLNAPFSIPHGFSFVVTDITVFPNCDGSG